MKRLLSVVAMLMLAASLLPVKGQAGLRGAFDPISNSDNLIKGKFSPTLRGLPTGGSGTSASPRVERWIAFVTLSQVVGSESTGEIWLYRNSSQAFLSGLHPQPMLRDVAGLVSYLDPAWSKDGKWLAYVQTDNSVTAASIYVQQYDTSTATLGNVALGAPILVADGTGGVHNRHPAFNSTATQIAYDSDAFGPSIDLWSVNVALDPTLHTGTVDGLSRTRHQLGLETDLVTQGILNGKAEFKPAYSPDNTKLAYVTNRFGVFQIQITTITASGLGETTAASENNPGLVTHDNPSWSSNGLSLYYDAPSNEDPANPQDIWKLDLATGQKCNIFIDLAGDVDPNVSQYTNPTADGQTFNYFVFISQAAGFGVQIWRGESVQNCVPALPIQVQVSPKIVDITQGNTDTDLIKTTLSFPASLIAQGFVCRAANVGGEAIRMRRSIIASPTLLGLISPATPDTGDCTLMDAAALLGAPGDTTIHLSCLDFQYYFGNGQGWWTLAEDTTTTLGVPNKNHKLTMNWLRRDIQARLVALNLVGKYVPMTIRAYTNRSGRQLLGFGYLQLVRKNYAASSIVMLQNYPNPFNPVTQVKFAVDKPGQVNVRVFNTRGELVKTIADTWYPQGQHTVAWDGSTRSGGHASSGVYYIRAQSGGGTDVIKAVLAK